MILKDAFRMLGMSPRIEFLVHGTQEHQAATDMVGELALWCDIAPKAGRGSFLHSPHVPIVLDHHKGAEELVRSFGDRGVFADEKLAPGVSGAVLAFRCVWERVSTATENFRDRFLVQDFSECVGARDCWQTQDPRFQRGQWISKALMSKPAAYWLSPEQPEHPSAAAGDHVPYLIEKEIQMGRAIFEAHEEAVRQAVEQCVMYEVAGPPKDGVSWQPCRLFVFQEQASGFRLCSDVAETLCVRPPHFRAVVAGFAYVVDKPGATPRLLYSLRGLGGFDVAAFAKANGGGGHTAAAGFSVVVQSSVHYPSPYEMVRLLLAKFLRGES
jgi:hypothetical protein